MLVGDAFSEPSASKSLSFDRKLPSTVAASSTVAVSSAETVSSLADSTVMVKVESTEFPP